MKYLAIFYDTQEKSIAFISFTAGSMKIAETDARKYNDRRYVLQEVAECSDISGKYLVSSELITRFPELNKFTRYIKQKPKIRYSSLIHQQQRLQNFQVAI